MKRSVQVIAVMAFFLFSKDVFSQQIKSGTYTFVNSLTPITVSIYPAGSISITGLGGAIAALNTYGVQSGGTVEFDFPGGYYEAATSQYSLGGAGSTLFSTPYNNVIFKYNGTSGNKPLIVGSTTGTGVQDYIIRLLGADYITFDGIDLKDTTANTTTNAQNEFGYYLLNSGSNGAQNDSIRNCKITLFNYGTVSTQQNINSIGILTSNTDYVATNSGNVFSYDTVAQAYNGILLRGIYSNPDIGNIVNNCVIGGANVGSIGAYVSQTSSGDDVLGLLMSHQSGFSVHDNIIQNCQYFRTGTSNFCYGVQLANISGNNSFYKNQIVSIISQRTGAATGAATAGIELEGLSTDSIDIYNNYIGNIECVGTSSSTFILFGIRINDSLGSSEKVNLFHNSVYIPNITSSQKASSAALYVAINAGTSVTLKDNILKNAAQTVSSSKVYACYFASGNSLVASDYNILDVNSGSPSGIYYTGYYLTANQQTFANWQSATGMDANSHEINASFSTSTSPVLGIPGYSANYQGIFITSPYVSITKDIFESIRLYPIIGAYEPNFTTKQVIITANNPGDSLVSLGTTQQLLAGVALTVGGVSNQLSSITFNISGTYSTSVPHDFYNIKLLYNTTNSLVGATILNNTTYKDSTVLPASGGTLSFTGLSKVFPLGANYLFVTFDVTTDGTPGDNIRIGTLDSTKITLLSGTNKIMSPSNPLTQGGVQTIAQYYYNYPDADITLTSSWYATVGAGGSPPDFVSNNQVFVFTANTDTTMGGPWMVGGTNSRIDVGDIYNLPLHSVTFKAKFPVYTLGNVKMNVRDSGTLQFQSSYVPTNLGTLDLGTSTTSGSTVEYGDTAITATTDTVKTASYCNLILSGLTTGTRTFPANVNVARVFNPGGFTAPTPLSGNISFNGNIVLQTIPTGFTFRGLKTNNSVGTTLLAGNVSVDSLLYINSNLTISGGQTLTLNSNATSLLLDTLLVNGSLTVNNPSSTEFIGATTSRLQFGDSSIYNLSANLNGTNGGQVPNATWASTSNINITNATTPTVSITAGAPTSAGFGNINFDAPALSSSILPYYLFGGFNYTGAATYTNPNILKLQGNLTLGRTNSNTVDLMNSGTGMLVFVGGNMTQNAGTYRLNNTNSTYGRMNITISGNDSINANYVYSPATGYSTPNQILSANNGYGSVLIGGDFVMLGGAKLTNQYITSIKTNLVFNGNTGNQNATFTNIVGPINFETNKTQVSGGADTVKLLSDAIADSFKLTRGVFSIGSNTLTIYSAVVYPNPVYGGYIGQATFTGGTYGSGTGTIAGSTTSNLTIGSSGYNPIAGTMMFATNTVGSPYNNYLRNFYLYGSSTATLGNALNIAAGTYSSPGSVIVDKTTGIGLTTGSFLTLKSDSAGTARVGQNGGTGSTYITGNVTIERYIQNGYRAWRFLTAPISSNQTINASWQEGGTNTTVSGGGQYNPNPGYGTEITNTKATPSTTGFDKAVTNNPSILYLSNGSYIAPLNTNSTNVNSQQGFMVFIRGDRSVVVSLPTFNPTTATILRTTGSLKEGNQTITAPALPAGINYQAYGNPYASEIKLDNIFTNYSSSIGSNYVMWDPKLGGNFGVGGYVYASYTGPGSYSSFNVHTTLFNPGRIESGQAFFFDAQASSSCIFKETDKTTIDSPLVFRPVNFIIPYLATTLSTVAVDGSLTEVDGTLNLFDNQFSDSVNWLEDAQKISNPGENLAILRNGKYIAIDKSQPLMLRDTIYFWLAQLNQQTYQLQFVPTGINIPGVIGILQDAFTGTTTPVSLTDTTTVNFNVTSAAASQGDKRFRIVFSNPAGGPLPVTYTSIKAWQQNNNTNNIAVQWNVTNQVNIQQYEVEKSTDGSHFTNAVTIQANTASNATYNWIDSNAVSGENYYRVHSIGSNEEVSYSQVVNVMMGSGNAGIAVYPNPVKGGVAGLQFTNMPGGNYTIRLLNTLGQQLIQTTIEHAGGNSMQTVKLGNNWAKGMYQLEIVKPDGSNTILNVLLQ